MYRVAIAILVSCSEKLLTLNGLEQLLPFLLNLPVEEIEPDKLMNAAIGLEIDKILKEERATYGKILRFL